MKCHICDHTLTTGEVQWNKDHKDWDPCLKCLEIINDIFNDVLTEAELDYLLEYENPELFPLIFQEVEGFVDLNE